MVRTLSLLLSLGASSPLFAWAQPAPAAAPAKAASAAAPLPRKLELFTLGRSSFTVLHDCQQRGWSFFARAGEKLVFRRGNRFALTAAQVLPSSPQTYRRFRLSFLNGRLAGIRAWYAQPDPARYANLRRHGPPTWESKERGEWTDRKSTAVLAWRDGSRLELVDLRLARRSGFLTADEIADELGKRIKKAEAEKPKPPAAKNGGGEKGKKDGEGDGKKDEKDDE